MDDKRVRFSGDTNVGMKRDHNEDSFYLPLNERLAVVADGMGGHASGEVASRMAVDTIVSYFRETEGSQELTWPFKVDRGHSHTINRLNTAIKLANQQIFDEAERNPECHGMGTTLVSSLFLDDVMLVGHVGDSRLYRIREGGIEQVTEDHSLLNDYIKMKKLSESEIAHFPHKNVIVRALGMKSSVEVDIIVEHPRLGDLYLLCSDGLSGMVSDTEIAGLAIEEPDLDKLCERLIATANANGGDDNITVVCARLEPL
jgi:protein phosphatase